MKEMIAQVISAVRKQALTCRHRQLFLVEGSARG